MTRIAVYGSLRRGQRSNDLLRKYDAKFVGEARVPGFDLFALTWFPGIRENEGNKDGVLVELYDIPEDKSEACLKHLDFYEGYFPERPDASLFARKEVEVEGKPTTLYTFNRNPFDAFGTSAQIVRTGDWVSFQKDIQNAA